MKFDKEGYKFEKKKVCVCVYVCMCGGRGGSALTPKLYEKLCHLRSNTEIQLSSQCRACSKINISKSKNSNLSSLLRAGPRTLEYGGGGGGA